MPETRSPDADLPFAALIERLLDRLFGAEPAQGAGSGPIMR